MYAGVPAMTEDFASAVSVLASPKSISFTSPAVLRIMFEGLTSRWMICRPCAKSSASSTCRAMRRDSSTAIFPSAPMTASMVRPSTSSIAMNIRPLITPLS